MKTLPQELLGKVRDLARGGDAIVETELGVVFAFGGAIGEIVVLRDLRREGKLLRARVARVEAPSPQRVEPPCPWVERCGGCPWMHLRLEEQERVKERFVSDAVRMPATLVRAPQQHAYRRRARLHFNCSAKRRVLGYRQWRGRQIEDIDSCLVLAPALDAALKDARRSLLPHLTGEGELALSLGDAGRAILAVHASGAQAPAVYQELARLVQGKGLAGASLEVRGTGSPALWGDARERTADLEGRELLGPIAGFSQANAAVNRELATLVRDLAAPAGADVLELYAGSGNLTVALGAGARSLVAVESDAAAAEACTANVRGRGLDHVEVVCASASTYVPRRPPTVVVLDPPRTGARDVVRTLGSTSVQRVVYVSCDCATLERDAVDLRALGFVPDAAFALDMFPETAHIEAVVRFVPAIAATADR